MMEQKMNIKIDENLRRRKKTKEKKLKKKLDNVKK
jgi:hypothetical protein